MITADIILNQNPAVFFAEHLNPVVGGYRCLPVAAAQIVFTGAGIDRILLTACKLNILGFQFSFGNFRRFREGFPCFVRCFREG